MKQSFDVHWIGDQKDWRTHLLSVGPSLLEQLAEQLLQNFKAGSFVSFFLETRTKTTFFVLRLHVSN